MTIQQLTARVIRKRYRSLLKQKLIDNQDYKLIGVLSYKQFRYEQVRDYSTADFYTAQLNDIQSKHSSDYIQVARALNQGRARKSKNISERIAHMILNLKTAYFITLTFDNDTLANTNALTRRRYVTRALKNNANHYLANIDFGEETHREHYHAVTNEPLTQEQWPYGFIKCLKIGRTDSEPIKIGKYITKLNNHALKRSTGGSTRFNTIIYSRTKKGV